MNGTLFAAAASLLLALCGCAEAPVSTAPPPSGAMAVAGAEPARKICHKERPTGSDFPMTVCRSVEDESEEAKDADAVRRRVAHDAAVEAAQRAAERGY